MCEIHNQKKTMKRIIYLVGILLTIVLGAYFQYVYCCGSCSKLAEKNQKIIKPKNLSNFTISTNGFSVNSDENFNFSPSSFEIDSPISEKIEGTIGELKEYFLDKPNKRLEIKGYYANFEKNNSVFPNLGLARANAVKKYLISKGFNNSKINIFGELTDKISSETDLLRGGVSYKINSINEEEQSKKIKKLEEFGNELKKNPITLYFNTGESYINLSHSERIKIQKINEYLNQVEGARLLVVGHTDNTGNRENNKALGEKRAVFVKNYFIKNGFLSSIIDVDSKGQDEPIDSNETEEGKAKNRRVEVTIK